MPWGAVVGGGLSLLGGLFGGKQQQSGGKELAQAYDKANQLQTKVYDQTYANLSPYVNQGSTSLGQLGTGTADYSSPLLQSAQSVYGAPPKLGALPSFNPTAADYQASPGYDWAQSQGINRISNQNVPGLGSLSGNSLKALDKYTVGLADQDYYDWIKNIYTPSYESQLYNVITPYGYDLSNYWKNIGEYDTTQGNQYNRLYNLSSLGQTSAAGAGTAGAGYANAYGTNLVGSAGSKAVGNLGYTNSVLGGVNSAVTGLGSGAYSNLGSSLSNLFSGLTGGVNQDFSAGGY